MNTVFNFGHQQFPYFGDDQVLKVGSCPDQQAIAQFQVGYLQIGLFRIKGINPV